MAEHRPAGGFFGSDPPAARKRVADEVVGIAPIIIRKRIVEPAAPVAEPQQMTIEQGIAAQGEKIDVSWENRHDPLTAANRLEACARGFPPDYLSVAIMLDGAAVIRNLLTNKVKR